jgi:hypothetical protein
MMNTRLFSLGAVLLALAGWSLTGSQTGTAADDDKEIKEGVIKLAEALEKKDAGSKKQAETIAKDAELDAVMHLLALRNKGGLGIGAKPGGITPDGIEAKLGALGKKALTKKDAEDQAAAIEKAGYHVAAIAEVATLKKPDKDAKAWDTWAKEMKENGISLAAAAKKKDGAEIKAAATKLEGTCNACHEKFR